MTFTEIFASDTPTTEKLYQISNLVATIRGEYGNRDIAIDIPEVNTADGVMKLTYVSNEDKLALAEGEFKTIIATTAEIVEETRGAVFDKVLVHYVATSPILCNITASTGSQYI